MVQTRREYIGAVCAVGAATVAGCESGEPAPAETTDSGTDNETDSGTDDESNDEYVSVATGAAAEITEWDETRRETVQELAQTDEIQTGTQEERQEYLVGRDEEFDDVQRIHLVETESNDIVASSNAAKQGTVLNSREAPWAYDDGIQYDEDGVFVSEATEALGIALVSFVTPVETDDDEELFLVVASDMDTVSGRFPAAPEGGYTLVLNAAGRIITGTRESDRSSRNDGEFEVYDDSTEPSEQPVIQRGLDGESGVLDGESVPGEYVVGFGPVSGFDWVTATHVPES